MKEMIETIESNENIKGTTFWEKILNSIRLEHIQENSFSEFETYGTYMMTKHPDVYAYRKLAFIQIWWLLFSSRTDDRA